MTFPRLTVSLTLLTLIAATNLEAETIYVNELGANPSAPYGSWETATDSLQDALTEAGPGDEIWVARGTYFPDEGAFFADNSRSSRFTLRDGIGIYGGFAGDETSVDTADPAANPTILSGEIQQDGDASNNAYHVISAVTEGASAVLQGFTIQGGNANALGGSFDSRGGGLNCFQASPTKS
jgi:hypothetical protein